MFNHVCDFLGSTSLCAINIAKSQKKISEFVMYVDGKLHINFNFFAAFNTLWLFFNDLQEQNNSLILDKFMFVPPHLSIQNAT